MYEKPLKKLLAHIYQSPRGQAIISEEILVIFSVHHHDVQEKHASTIACLYQQVGLRDIKHDLAPWSRSFALSWSTVIPSKSAR